MPQCKDKERKTLKRSARSSSPSRPLKKIRRTPSDDVPEVIDTFGDHRDWSKVEGMPWARKNGFAHVKRVTRKDALEILNFLHITCEDDFSDGYGDLTAYNNPWSWLQQYSEAGGDLHNLSIKPRH